MSEITTAHLTTDVVLFAADARGVPQVLLIRRGWDPYAGRWALPGGYVDTGETFEQAAHRELDEETGLAGIRRFERVGVYDRPNRDPRGRVVSVAFAAWIDPMPTPTAGHDAREARWMPVREALTSRLAFDHADILRNALARSEHTDDR